MPSYVSAFSFEARRPWSIEELIKLAPSIDAKSETLVVVKSAEGLVIDGVVQFGAAVTPLNTLPRQPSPMGFALTTRDPGRIVISLGSFLFGRFEDGTFRRPEPGVFAPSGDLGKRLYRLATNHTWHELDRGKYAALYLQSVQEIIHEMGTRGHGGTLFISQERLLPEVQRNLDIRRSIGHVSQSGVDYVAHVLRSGTSVERQMLNSLRHYVGMLAQLTCIDGSVVIDEFLKPVGFSAMSHASVWSGEIQNRSVLDPTPVDRKRLGARHNAAINVVGSVPGTFGFVVSQDGPARALVRDGETVLWWPDCTTSGFG